MEKRGLLVSSDLFFHMATWFANNASGLRNSSRRLPTPRIPARRNRPLVRCLHRIQKEMNKWMPDISPGCSSPSLTCGTLPFRIHKIVSSPPPHTCNSEEKDTHYNHRAGIGARIHIPRPFLKRPNSVLENWVQPAPPKKERCSGCNVRIELVVERTGKQHANCISCEDSR